jgi:hypothetical protein
MRTGARLRSWLRATLHRSRTEREMESELRFHIERYTEDLVQDGVPIEDAVFARTNPDLNLEFTTLATEVDESLNRERLLATLSGFSGALVGT